MSGHHEHPTTPISDALRTRTTLHVMCVYGLTADSAWSLCYICCPGHRDRDPGAEVVSGRARPTASRRRLVRRLARRPGPAGRSFARVSRCRGGRGCPTSPGDTAPSRPRMRGLPARLGERGQRADQVGTLTGGEPLDDRGDLSVADGADLVDQRSAVSRQPQYRLAADCSGLLCRVARPRRSSRSSMRMAVEGFTPSRSATSTSLASPWMAGRRGAGTAAGSPVPPRPRGNARTRRPAAVRRFSTAWVTASTSASPSEDEGGDGAG